MNEFKATAKFKRISPFRARYVGKLVRGKNVNRALEILSGTPNKSAGIIASIIRSAKANAVHMDEEKKLNIDADQLVITDLVINGGPIIHRWRPMSMGRAGRIRKRTSHITVVLSEPVGN